MIIKTIRDLKNMLNAINDNRILDKEIKYCHQSDGGGTRCEGAWFDIQDYGYEFFPAITICEEKEDLLSHEGRIPWNSLSEIFDEEEV